MPVSLRGAFLRRTFGLAIVTGSILLLTATLLAGRRASTLASERASVVSNALISRLSSASARQRDLVVHHLRVHPGLAVAVTAADRLVTGEIPGIAPARLRQWAALESGTEGGWAFSARTLPPPRQAEVAIVAVRVPTLATLFEVGGGARARSPLRSLAIVSLSFLALILVAALLMARELASELHDVGSRIRAMVGPGVASEVPITTLDELGDLERAFNRLWSRHRIETQRHTDAQVVLDQADRYKSEFLATVSHELRTPLNPILGFSQVLLTGMDGPLTPSQAEDLKIVEQSGNHLLSLINDILDLSAMESGRIDLHREPTDVAELSRQVVRTGEGQLRGKKLRLSSHVPDDLPACDADPKRLLQILVNLVSNAIKFTDKGEVVIEASAAPAADMLELRVRDTGPGIPSSESESIFEEYKQLGETTRRRRGTGLGLAIVKRLVDLHGGTIRVESRMGQGSTFVLTLPIARPSALPAGAATSLVSAAPPSGAPR